MNRPAEQFDPYLKWLGIRDPERPPNHYRLLGLETYESDVDVIATAADRQMAHVRRFQHGAHVDLSQQLLNQLAAAKVCLLRPETKAAYDAQLRQDSERAKGAVLASHRSGPIPRRAPEIRRSRRAPWIALGALIVAAMLWFAWRSADRPVPYPQPAIAEVHRREGVEADHRTQESEGAGEAGESGTGMTDSAPVPHRAESTDTVLPSPPADSSQGPPPEPGRGEAESQPDESSDVNPMRPLHSAAHAPVLRPPGERGRVALDPRGFDPARPVPPAQVHELSAVPSKEQPDEIALTGLDASEGSPLPGTFARLRGAMRIRNLPQADTLIKKLEQESSSYTQREAAERMRLVLFELHQFWAAVREGLAIMKPGLQLNVGGESVEVRDVKPGQIVFQIGKEEKSMATDVESIDSGLAMTLATVHFLRLGASPQPALAAFLAVDGGGNPTVATTIWREMRRRNMATPLPVREPRHRFQDSP